MRYYFVIMAFCVLELLFRGLIFPGTWHPNNWFSQHFSDRRTELHWRSVKQLLGNWCTLFLSKVKGFCCYTIQWNREHKMLKQLTQAIKRNDGGGSRQDINTPSLRKDGSRISAENVNNWVREWRSVFLGRRITQSLEMFSLARSNPHPFSPIRIIEDILYTLYYTLLYSRVSAIKVE